MRFVNLPSFLSVFVATACVFTFANPHDAEACSVVIDPCEVTFKPGGKTIPGNAPGFIVERSAASPGVPGFESIVLVGPGDVLVPTTISKDLQNAMRWTVLPDANLAPGAYRMVVRKPNDSGFCSSDAGVEESDGGAVSFRYDFPFSVAGNEPIPTSLGTISLEPPTGTGIRTFRVKTELNEETKKFLPLLVFELKLDGKTFSSIVSDDPLSSELKVRCDDSQGFDSCSSEQTRGRHTLKLEATLPGHPETITTAQIDADLLCPGETIDAGVPSGSGTGSNESVSACGCKVPGSATEVSLFSSAMLGLATTWIVRRLRRRNNARPQRRVDDRNG